MRQNLVISEQGKIHKVDDVELAEAVVKERKKGPWQVIDLLVRAWAERTPEEFQAFKFQIEDYRAGLDDPTFGQTRGGKDMERRFTMIFPMSLQAMIRSQYKADELPFDRGFFREFARKYPFFKIAKKN